MRIRSKRHVWIFVVAVVSFAVCVVVFEQFFLKKYASDTAAGFIVAPLAAFPIAYVVGQKVRELNLLYDERERLIRFDRLTGALSRTHFFDYFTRRPHAEGTVVMVDIDHFKSINDTHGHLAGDEVIKAVSGVLIDVVREEDMVCRFGGEEFTAFLNRTDMSNGLWVAERMRAEVAELTIVHADREIPVRISAGVAKKHPHLGIENAILRADEALYRAKEGGRNRVESNEVPEPAILHARRGDTQKSA